MSFDSLNLHPKILKAVEQAGYSEATEVQLKVIPKIVNGFDVRASAQTGTGKTAAFLLPALNRLTVPSTKSGKGPRVLVLVPTRELAMQIASQAEKYSKYLNSIKTVCVVGGVPYHAQTRKLSAPYDILIATPGRLIDFMDRGKINFSRLEMLILDEADRMLDMGFSEPVDQIVQATPKPRQTLLFSATLQGSVIKLSERLMDKPMEIIVRPDTSKESNITQKIYYADNLGHKKRLLESVLDNEEMKFRVVFTSTKRQADSLVEELKDKDYRAAPLHGDMNQRQRTRTIAQLRNGRIKILVATDVAARGIDVQAITHVINFDLPNNVEDYVHRIGRTGRAGAEGIAISLVSGRDAFFVKKIEEYIKKDISVEEIEGLEPREKIPSSPQEPRRGGPRSRPNFNRRFRSGGGNKSGSKRQGAPKRQGSPKRQDRSSRSARV